MSLREKRTESFTELIDAEQKWILTRREKAGLNPGEPGTDALGLGLSGGGIRSATFNLGLLQALNKNNSLKQVDYLSTVSGGGYIGSSLTWLKSRVETQFPFGTTRKDHSGIGGSVLAWLRAHGSYMTPGEGINVWSLIAAVLTGMVVNLAILLPIFLMVFFLLSREFSQGLTYPAFFPQWLPPDYMGDDGFTLVLYTGFGLLTFFLLQMTLFVLSTQFPRYRDYSRQRKMREFAGVVLMACVIFLVVGTIPIIYDLLVHKVIGWVWIKMSAISLFGVFSIMGGMHGRTGGNETKGIRSFLLSAGLSLLIYGLFLWFYHLTMGQPSVNQAPAIGFESLVVMMIISLILAFTANINQVSMHRFYRNRLMEAYMPFSIKGAAPEGNPPKYYPYATEKEMDCFFLKQIPITDAPYHIVNTNLQTVGSDNPKLNMRGGDNFIFSPKYIGSASTDYVKTEDYMGGTSNLATALAISGAAVDPNCYATRSRPLSFLMSLLNVRLGCWVRNPRHPAMGKSLGHPMWYYYMLREMLGKGLDEKCWQIHLSDGGHFENLGLYELVRRQCRYIIISDAAADADWTFTDLAKVMEMVRVDFGARVNIDIEALKPKGEDRISDAPFVKGTITYNQEKNGETNGVKKADLIYIKTSMIQGLTEDLYSYRRDNPSFPDQSTADQFFDERQFEAYRELGFLIGKNLGKIEDTFNDPA